MGKGLVLLLAYYIGTCLENLTGLDLPEPDLCYQFAGKAGEHYPISDISALYRDGRLSLVFKVGHHVHCAVITERPKNEAAKRSRHIPGSAWLGIMGDKAWLHAVTVVVPAVLVIGVLTGLWLQVLNGEL